MFGPLDGELEIVVSLSAQMRVVLRDPREADTFAVLDEDGEELELEADGPQEGSTFWRAALVDGRSETLSVSDDAAWLVLYRGKRAVRTVPVQLCHDRPTLLEA